MTAAEMIRKLPLAFDAPAASGVDCIIQFNVSTPMHVVIKEGTCLSVEGTAASSDLAITMEDDDLVALLKGELNGMQAFMTGKLQIEGDMMLAQRMTSFFDASKVG
ncbi:MAG: SCP2 sterol-binding domain-containing protein [Panacagrimonas sp.]